MVSSETGGGAGLRKQKPIILQYPGKCKYLDSTNNQKLEVVVLGLRVLPTSEFFLRQRKVPGKTRALDEPYLALFLPGTKVASSC